VEEKIKIFNREISLSDIELIRSLIEKDGSKGRTYISKELCRIWQWKNPTGQYRDIACRILLRRLEQRGKIKLPVQQRKGRQSGYKNKTKLPRDLEIIPVDKALSEISSIEIEMVRRSSKEAIYNGLIEKYHYLGYHQGQGEQLKYIIYGDGAILACIGFGGAAYKISARDTHIGWSEEIRKENLRMIVGNNRFLILPEVKIYNLASYILGKIVKRIRDEWKDYYKTEIALLESFVEDNRFTGASYRASNWQYIGKTKGRGRNDRQRKYGLPVKSIYIYPLVKNYKEVLRRGKCVQR
jgi:hypothetical protein